MSHDLTREQIEALAIRIRDVGVYAYDSEQGIYFGDEQGHAWVAPADVTALATEVLAYRTALSAVMPTDFKDWHENSTQEWPEVAAAVIISLREREDLAYRQLDAQRERRCGTCEHWAHEDGNDICQHLRLANVAHSFGCADWRAKEER
jgi:hypothetical protein